MVGLVTPHFKYLVSLKVLVPNMFLMFTRLHLNVKISGLYFLQNDLLSPYGFTREREIIPQDSIGCVVHQKLKFLLCFVFKGFTKF